jgi:hypothetical protein
MSAAAIIERVRIAGGEITLAADSVGAVRVAGLMVDGGIGHRDLALYRSLI